MLQSDDTPQYQTLLQWSWAIPLKIQSLPQYDHPGALDVHTHYTPGNYIIYHLWKRKLIFPTFGWETLPKTN